MQRTQRLQPSNFDHSAVPLKSRQFVKVKNNVIVIIFHWMNFHTMSHMHTFVKSSDSELSSIVKVM